MKYRIKRISDEHGVYYYPQRTAKTFFGRTYWKTLKDRYGSAQYHFCRDLAIEAIKRQKRPGIITYESID